MNVQNLTLKEIPVEDRPTERLLALGAQALTNAELLAVLIRTGTRSENAVQLAQKILGTTEGLGFLSSSTTQELGSFKGIGRIKAAQIKASMELGRRMIYFRKDPRNKVVKPGDAVELLMEEMRYLKKEHLRVIFLNTKNRIIDINDLSIGCLSSSFVQPREIYSEAIRKSCASIIVCHNHPSGDPTPSNEDIQITKRLIEVGKLVGIELLDHLIFGDGDYISLKEKGII